MMFDAPCLMRSAATQALDRAGIPAHRLYQPQPERRVGGGECWIGRHGAHGGGFAARPGAAGPRSAARSRPARRGAAPRRGSAFGRRAAAGADRGRADRNLILGDRLLAAQLAPFAPGAVIQLDLRRAERQQAERQHRRRHAGAAAGDDRAVDIHPLSLKVWRSASSDLKRPFSSSSPYGMLMLPGIWPRCRPGRGSGASA